MRLRQEAQKAWKKQREYDNGRVEFWLSSHKFLPRKLRVRYNDQHDLKLIKLQKKLGCRFVDAYDMAYGDILEIWEPVDEDKLVSCALYRKRRPFSRWHLVALNHCSRPECNRLLIGREISSVADIHAAVTDDRTQLCISHESY